MVGDGQVAPDQLICKLDDPILLNDCGQIVQIEVFNVVSFYVSFHFINNQRGFPGAPFRGPHQRAGAKCALEGATTRGHKRHVAGMHAAVPKPAGHIILQRHQIPCRNWNTIDVANAFAPLRGVDRLAIHECDTTNTRQVIARANCVDDIDHSLFAFAHRDNINVAARGKDVIGAGRCMLAPDDDLRVGESFPDRFNESPLKGPAVGEHAGETDDIRRFGNRRDNLRHGQADSVTVAERKRENLVRILTDRIDDVRGDTVRPERTRQISQT